MCCDFVGYARLVIDNATRIKFVTGPVFDPGSFLNYLPGRAVSAGRTSAW